ncbi:MAG: ornithine cyclodeaminase family protein [Bryobacteraceae bacterium]|jgi:ornithine cyclodeaminase/alanine dehydrogenase-like protein (mu-crystallin family)
MLHITEQQVIDILSMAKAIELVDQSFRQLADGTAINHPRRRLILPTGSILHYMAAGNFEYFGIKIYSSNPKTGAHFQFLLYRASNGIQIANIEANHLGQIRTGAASGVATNYLARADADTLGVIGSGFQAETQIAAMALVRKLREVRVWSRKPERRERFARQCAGKFGLPVYATETAREAVENARIVVTATNSKEPVLESAWIAPGTHINAMGSNWLTRRELPTDLVMDRADLVTVDSVQDAHLESGDLMIPLSERAGAAFRAIDLCEIVAGRNPGRTSPSQITIFKSNGLAAQDVAVAGYIVEHA